MLNEETVRAEREARTGRTLISLQQNTAMKSQFLKTLDTALCKSSQHLFKEFLDDVFLGKKCFLNKIYFKVN